MYNYKVQLKLENLDFYADKKNINYNFYVLDLKHQAPALIKEALVRPDYKVYGITARKKTTKCHWLQHTTYGATRPTTICIELFNGVKILDLSNFLNGKDYTEKDLEPVAKILETYRAPMTACSIIKASLPSYIASIPLTCTQIELENYAFLLEAMRGGAINTKVGTFDYETHVDYHSLYSSCMLAEDFPCLAPVLIDGYAESKFSIYKVYCTVKLRKNGYALLSDNNLTSGSHMLASDGNEHEFDGYLCDPDFKLLKENYIVKDLTISQTLLYQHSFSGKSVFKDLITKIYADRKSDNKAIKNFAKLCTEVLAGYFERSIRPSTFWKALDPSAITADTNQRLNPIVGIFITAYGRQRLNKMLHLCDNKTVIGFDTDCVFLNLKKEDTPKALLELFGEQPGQLHFDGVYKSVKHIANKYYQGYDLEEKVPFRKQSGYSKSGYTYHWDKEKKEYVIKKAEDNDKAR